MRGFVASRLVVTLCFGVAESATFPAALRPAESATSCEVLGPVTW